MSDNIVVPAAAVHNLSTNNGTELQYDCDVVIVGAGVAGASTLYHIIQNTNSSSKRIIIIDAGSQPGFGFDCNMDSTSKTSSATTVSDAQSLSSPRYSGSAVFLPPRSHDVDEVVATTGSTVTPATVASSSVQQASPEQIPKENQYSYPNQIIKMMVQIFACSMESFITHHGIEGAQTYLQCTQQGLQIQKSLAQRFTMSVNEDVQKGTCNCNETALPSSNRTNYNSTCNSNILIKEHGSMYMAYKEDAMALRKEYEQFVSLSKETSVLEGIEWYEKLDAVSTTTTIVDDYEQEGRQQPSHSSDNPNDHNNNVMWSSNRQSYIITNSHTFHCGIYFPNDAIIDSSRYAKLLVQHSMPPPKRGGSTGDHDIATTTTVVDDLNHPPPQQQPPIRVMMNTMVTHVHRLPQREPTRLDSTQDGRGDTPTTSTTTVRVEGYHVRTQQKVIIHCRHVVMATGGLSIPQGCCTHDLLGKLQACYSYLAHVPMSSPMIWKKKHVNDTTMTKAATDCEIVADDDDDPQYRSSNSGGPNFFTWKFTHDWCYTDRYHIRMSGEDHFSALKEPKYNERCSNLIRWTYQQYNDTAMTNSDKCHEEESRIVLRFDEKTIPQQFGIYTETPDYVPLIGFTPNDDCICYIVGCNAWGQTILSYAATLVPAILGYRSFTPFEKKAMDLLSIQRFKYTMNSKE
jgi:hypothetical protein